jgi:type IV secretion system protein TrbB
LQLGDVNGADQMAGKGDESRRRLIAGLKDSLGDIIITALNEIDVVEIMLNQDGRLFIERVGAGMEHAGAMSAHDAEIVIGKVAHALGTEITPDRPIISGELPLDGHRFEGLLPPVVSKPVFTIRKKASLLIGLDAYVADGIMSQMQAAIIRDAVAGRKNIIVSGGTGTGKTTLTNAIIAEMVVATPAHRLVILEDTAEIQCAAENAVLLHTSDNVDMQRLLKSTMRLRPDRIIVGEVRDGAALTLLKAWNTGHPGGIATVHSDSAMTALIRLEQLIAEVSQQPMPQVIAEASPSRVFGTVNTAFRPHPLQTPQLKESFMSRKTFALILTVAAATLFLIDPAFASSSGSLPWESPLETIQESITGPVAGSIGLAAVAIAGGMLIFGGELNDFARRMAYIVLVLGILLGASTIVGLFSSSGASIGIATSSRTELSTDNG